MRLRNIPGADDAILNSEYCIKNPEEQKGHWQDCFETAQPLHIEIGIQSQADEVLRRLRGQKEMIGMANEPTASIGIAFGPEDGTSFRELYHRADEALYQVKKDEIEHLF